MDVQSLRDNLSQYGQEHLVQFWDQLDHEGRQELLHDIGE